MPSIGHIAVGLAAARLSRPPAEGGEWGWRLGLVLLLPALVVGLWPRRSARR